MHDVTLQINLSPGDINYATATVPVLVNAHRANVDEKLAVVDCCRPQKTKIIDPERRFPEPEFSRRVERICSIAEDLKAQGYFDRIVYLKPGNTLQPLLVKKYLGSWVKTTHDYGACALMAYLAAFEVINTRYLIHYDADMLLHHETNYDWAVEAKAWIEKSDRLVAATPRISPPFAQESQSDDAPSHSIGRPLDLTSGGWQDDWFSSRCFLLDNQKLSKYLPLIQGRLLLETLAVKYLNRGYPRSPEIMLFKRVGGAGGRRLNLKSQKAWLLHPATKTPKFLELLPKIQQAVVAGQVPDAQKGHPDIDLAAWENFFIPIGESCEFS